MKAKHRVTLVLACIATGSHNIPVFMVGKAKQPLCCILRISRGT
mgnify:CR=1 FL=1